jgi:hypothetical protein
MDLRHFLNQLKYNIYEKKKKKESRKLKMDNFIFKD